MIVIHARRDAHGWCDVPDAKLYVVSGAETIGVHLCTHVRWSCNHNDKAVDPPWRPKWGTDAKGCT